MPHAGPRPLGGLPLTATATSHAVPSPAFQFPLSCAPPSMGAACILGRGFPGAGGQHGADSCGTRDGPAACGDSSQGAVIRGPLVLPGLAYLQCLFLLVALV